MVARRLLCYLLGWVIMHLTIAEIAAHAGQIEQIDHNLDHLLSSVIDLIDNDLDNLHPSCRYDKLCRICVVQILQPRKCVLDDADYTAPTRHHGLGHTAHIYR